MHAHCDDHLRNAPVEGNLFQLVKNMDVYYTEEICHDDLLSLWFTLEEKQNKTKEEALIEENIYIKISLITRTKIRFRLTSRISIAIASLIPETKQKHTFARLNDDGTCIGLTIFIQQF